MGALTDERCDVTDLPKYSCAHCLKLNAPDPTEGYKLVATFTARFDSECALDDEHRVIKGKVAGTIEDTSNPFKGTVEYCCAACVKRFQDKARG